MIVNFFSRGTGGGRGPVEYLLGKDHDRELAELLRGDALETIALIDSSPYAKKYTSGCLSFEENDLTPEKKRELMDSFEEALFPGMDKSQYNVLWVEHRDKGRLELNFVIPNIELTTGRRLQPYFYKADEKRVDAWKTIQNITHGFSDPDDPAKRQALTPAKDLPASSKAIADDLHAGIEAMIASGQIENRGDIVAALEAAGFTMARQTKTFISIENPEKGGRNIRLKGGVYGQDFDISKELPSERERRSAAHQQRLGERLERARERYGYGIEVKRAELAGSFKGQRKGYERSHPAAAKSDFVGEPLAARVAHNSSVSVDRLERLARRESAGAVAGDSAGQRDAGELAERLAGGADRGQELLADERGAAAIEAAQGRQKHLVYTVDGVKDDEQQREARSSAGSVIQSDRPRAAEPLLGMQKGIRTYTEKHRVSSGEGRGRGRDQGQIGEREESQDRGARAGHSLRALQRSDNRLRVPLRAFSAAGGRVDDGNRGRVLRHIKQVGERLHQGFRSAAAGVAAARDRFLESCQRLSGAGQHLEQASVQLERAERGAERASVALGGAIEALVMRAKQEQKQAKNVKPSGGFRMR
jgi:hypothetical protein